MLSPAARTGSMKQTAEALHINCAKPAACVTLSQKSGQAGSRATGSGISATAAFKVT